MEMVDSFLLVGSQPGEHSISAALVKDSKVSAYMEHANPGMIDIIKECEGEYMIGPIRDIGKIIKFAEKISPDIVFVSFDISLKMGIVDKLREQGFTVIGSTKTAAKIENDKSFALDIVKKIHPDKTPKYACVRSKNEIKDTINEFKKDELEIAIRPVGLSGGLKTMDKELDTYKDCADYAKTIISKFGKPVIMEEYESGMEFTLVGFVDESGHLELAPPTYPSPYRHENDTDGISCFTDKGGFLSFLTHSDILECRTIMQDTINMLKENGTPYSGIINGGFLKTANEIKFMEYGAGFGDPEVMNVMMLLDDSFSETLFKMSNGRLYSGTLSFMQKASVVKYLVTKEYPNDSRYTVEFKINQNMIESNNASCFYGYCERYNENVLKTIGHGKVLALGCTADTVYDAANNIDTIIDSSSISTLKWKNDIIYVYS